MSIQNPNGLKWCLRVFTIWWVARSITGRFWVHDWYIHINPKSLKQCLRFFQYDRWFLLTLKWTISLLLTEGSTCSYLNITMTFLTWNICGTTSFFSKSKMFLHFQISILYLFFQSIFLMRLFIFNDLIAAICITASAIFCHNAIFFYLLIPYWLLEDHDPDYLSSLLLAWKSHPIMVAYIASSLLCCKSE